MCFGTSQSPANTLPAGAQGELSDNGRYRLNNREFNPDGPLRVNRDGEWYSGKPVNWQPYNVYYDNPYLDAVWDEDSGGWLVTEVEAFRHEPIIFRSETGIDSLTRRYNASKGRLNWLQSYVGLPLSQRPQDRSFKGGGSGTSYTDVRLAELIEAEKRTLYPVERDLWQRQREDIRKDALDRLRTNEAAEAARQERERQRLFEEQQQALADQTQQINDLQAEQEAQQEQLERENLATQAGVRSLNVLAGFNTKESTAPTATLTGAPHQQRGRRRSSTQSLRIGSSRQAPSVGLNIGL